MLAMPTPSRHRHRPAYHRAAAVSVYVAPTWRRGVGRALYGRLLADLTECGYRLAPAGRHAAELRPA
jgi:L-amino acid N-acyltransferase YncA